MAKKAGPKGPSKIDWSTLVRAAAEVRLQAYAPYSKFLVGSAILGESGKVYIGCNVENSSFGVTLCAERNAIGSAIAAGEKRVLAVAIAAGDQPCPPCGMCRQALAEFGAPEMPVALVSADGKRTVHQLGDLLPHSFDKTWL